MHWVIFGILVLLVLALDLLVFNRKAHKISFKEALIWSLVWVGLALVFNVYVYFIQGKESALNFLTGYLIEKSLSVDNLFVFILIFSYFQTPDTLMHKVMFWGILGAIIARAVFIFLGLALVQHLHFIIYVFGLFLIVTGIQFLFNRQKSIHPEKNWLVKIASRLFPVIHEYRGDRFFVRKEGKLYATLLWIVLLSIEATDIVFAIDSIPAILAITDDPFIVFTSNIFAILGLRALFFLLAGLLKLSKYLHYGIALILVFVGCKMILSHFYKISPLITLGVITLILTISILASILLSITRKKEK